MTIWDFRQKCFLYGGTATGIITGIVLKKSIFITCLFGLGGAISGITLSSLPELKTKPKV